MLLRRALGSALGLVVRAWLASLRVRVEAPLGLDPSAPTPWCLALWHGQQFGLLAWPRRRKVVALVSRSPDGEMLARALARLGLGSVRGSSSRGGASALLELVRRLRRGNVDAAFAVDGPRGPASTVRPGVLAAARASGGLVVPIACAARPAFVFARSWDKFELPLPFARLSIVLGEPIASANTDALEVIGAELAALRLRAEALITRPTGVRAARSNEGVGTNRTKSSMLAPCHPRSSSENEVLRPPEGRAARASEGDL